MVAFFYLVASALCLRLALGAWRGDRAHAASRAYVLFTAQLGVAFALFALYLTGLPWLSYGYAALAALLPLSLQRTVEHLLGDGHPTRAFLRLRDALFAAVVAYLAAEPFFGGAPRASAPEVALGIAATFGFALPLWRLWRQADHAATRAVRAHMRILFGVLLAALVSAGLEMLSRALTPLDFAARRTLGVHAFAWALQGRLPPLGAVLFTAFAWFLGRVVAAALDVRELLARAFTLATLAAGLVLFQRLLLQTFGDPGSIWTHDTFLLYVVACGFLIAYEPLRRELSARAGEWFNRPGTRLRQDLDEVDHALAKVLTMDAFNATLVDNLHASGRASVVALYLWEPDRGLYRLAHQRGELPRPPIPTIAARPFTDGFLKGARAYLRDELRRKVERQGPGAEEAGDRLRILDAMGADVSLPFLSGGEVLGWLNLSAGEPAEGFAPDEVRRLRDTADRAAIALENIAGMGQIEEQRRLAALGTMAAGLAHEIRNPLAGIKGAAQYLDGSPDPAEIKDFLAIIVDEVNRMNEVVAQFLDYARPLRLSVEPTDVGQLIRRVLELVEREGPPSGVVLEAEIEPGLPLLPMDRDKIKQVLLNLVQNAVQASGERGRVRVRAAVQRAPEAGNRWPEALTIAVIDEGAGLTREDLDKLFIPFFTRKQGGTGLGLAISRRLVQAHGGDIGVQSNPGVETRFTVRLPVRSMLPADR